VSEKKKGLVDAMQAMAHKTSRCNIAYCTHPAASNTDQNICIGHGQESQTDEVDISVYTDPINNYSVTLVDTPGFDDSRKCVSDIDILQRIVDFLQFE
jgi:hypothetical protein